MSLAARLKDWAPKAHDKPVEYHMDRMYHIGDPNGILYMNPLVFIGSAVCIWAFVVYAMIAQEEAEVELNEWKTWVANYWNWLYIISQNIWIVILLYLMYKHWDLKLGKDDEEPEFSNAGYFAMLFSAGLATGLWYYTAESMWHYEGYGTPRWTDKQMWNDNSRAEHAMMVTWFHWGLHGWIAYVIGGAVTAIMTYRRGFPMTIRFTLYPLIGEMVYGVMGDLIEILSILCTLFGVCTSLGLGAMQITAGLVRLDRGTWRGEDKIVDGIFGIEETVATRVVVIMTITLFATASVLAGLKSGIQSLSMIAFALGIFIVMSVLFMDETAYILNALTSVLGYYCWYLPKIAFHTDAWEELGNANLGLGGAPDGRGGKAGWMNGWTLFYWGWWISWGPFVGTFLARISKNRKLGEFILACLILPSLWTFVFLGVFGAAQIRISNQAISNGLDFTTVFGHGANGTKYGQYNANGAWVPVPDDVTRLYGLATQDVVFEHLCTYGGPGWSFFMTLVTLVCIVLYFVTSSDSASYIVDIISANGMPEPPALQKIFWALTEGLTAAALLISGGSDSDSALKAVQVFPIVLGLFFTFVMFWMCQSLLILCEEESGQLSIERKQFSTFILNLEPASFMSFVVPFVPLGSVAEKAWGGNAVGWMVGFGFLWVTMVVFMFLGIADMAFLQMGFAMYFVIAASVAMLRNKVREKTGVCGSMTNDACVVVMTLPFAIGQMAAEDFSDTGKVPIKGKDANVKDDNQVGGEANL